MQVFILICERTKISTGVDIEINFELYPLNFVSRQFISASSTVTDRWTEPGEFAAELITQTGNSTIPPYSYNYLYG
jgi:hypothetical protein